MDFTKGVFLFYFLPFFLVLHFVTPKKFRKIVDVLASIIFYAWGAGWITFVLLASVCIDFWLTAGIRDNNINKRKYFLLSSILLNITPFFYYAFYQATDTDTLVTIGLGFFTLQKIGYSIDVYRNVSKSFVQFIDYCFYILYFPKLISGPFVKLEVYDLSFSNCSVVMVKDRWIFYNLLAENIKTC